MITKIIPIALAYIMFTLGLGLQLSDFLEIKHHKKAFLAGLANQILLVPIIFFSCVIMINPSPEIAFGLMLISFCPGGVTSNLFTKVVDGNVPLSIALTGLVSLLSVLNLPILTAIAYQFFFREEMTQISIARIGFSLFILTTIPVTLGMLLRKYFTQYFTKNITFFSKSATGVFILILVMTVITQKASLIKAFTSLAFVLPFICLVLLALSTVIARILSLSDADQRTLSIETSVQNGSVGITVALLVASNSDLPEYALPSLLYGLLMNTILVPFAWWNSAYR